MAHSSVRFSHRLGRVLILAGFVTGNLVAPALAGPSGGRVISGQGAISQSGPNATINQGSDRLIIEWQNFDTSAGESVRFNQPSSSASVLNRIISGNATIFDGSLFANGNVIIVNGSGIHFGPNSRVDVGSLIASTADISNSNFLNNRLIFDRPGQPDASITNAGTITVRDTGLAALVAPGVENSGLIQANLGTVILAAGEAHTIDFNGDGLMSFTVTKPTTAKPKDRNGKTLDALVSNKGEIRADGGTVLLTARQASRVLDNSINMSGVIRANSVGVRNGKIVLFGGNKGRVNVSGKIRARGKRRGQRGGRVHITGRKIAVPIAKIDVTGKAGGGEVLIGGAYKGGKLASDSSIGYLQSGDLVSILTGTNAGAAGNGYIPTAEGVYVGQDAVIDVSATEAGNGGQAILWADGTTIFNGTIRARGGDLSGDGGFIETSGAGRLGVGATAGVDALAPNGRVGDWLLDPLSVTVAAGGMASLAEIADAADVANALTVNPTTLNNAMANVSIVASDFITFAEAITMVNAGVGLTATAGNLITVDAALSTNNGDISFISDEYAINAAVNAGTGTILFDRATAGSIEIGLAPGTGSGGADLDTSELARLSAGSLVFGSPTASGNRLNSISIRGFGPLATVTGQTRFNALNDSGSFILVSGDQTYRSVAFNANDGVAGVASNTIMTTSGDAIFNVDADNTGTAGGFNDLLAQNGVDLVINSAADILVTGPRVFEGGTGTLTFNANAGAGAITFQRNTAGTIGVGTGATGDLTFDNDILGRMTAATINFGNTNDALSNTSAVNVNAVNLSAIGTTVFNTQAAGTTTFSGANNFASVSANGGTTTVSTSATVGATGTIGFNTATVNLDGNLTASGGITGTATTVNVQGSTGGAEIQDAVDVAATGATVNVADGSYSSFIVNKENLTVDGAGAGTIINTASPAITIAANGVTVQDMLLQGTGIVDDVGILLDGTAAPNLTGISITNVDFSNLDDGVRSQGDIGDGVAANIDVAISGTDASDPAIFEDFLDAAIDVGDTDGDAVYTVTDVTVRDGAVDADVLSSDVDGIRFGAVGGVSINRVDVSGTAQDGVQFGAIADATVTVSNSSIDAGRHGLLFSGAISGATTAIDIAGNTLIQGANQGVVFTQNVTDASVTINGNGTNASNGIRGNFDAIAVNGATLTNVAFLIGGATTADGNYIVSPNAQALDIEAISGGTFVVANNQLIQGASGVSLEFEGAVSNGANVEVVTNTAISGTLHGIDFLGDITDSTVTIAGNGIVGLAGNTNGHGINFQTGTSITDSMITIGSAAVTIDGTPLTPGGNTISGGGTGIIVAAIVDGDTTFNITDNQIGTSTTRMGVDGILFENGILGTATVTIGGTNQVFATNRAVNVNDLQSPSTLSITGGSYDGTGGALLVDNTGVAGTDGLLNVGTAAYVGGTGSTVFEVLTDAGNAGVDIDFSGSATFDGGANGVRLSGTGIDVLNDTFGTISFGATTAQTGNIIELANGAEFLPGSPTILDATNTLFGGTAGSALPVPQLFALETQLVHFPDDATLGLINTNDLFVVQGESIQTAVNAAGALAGAQTVTVTAGTFGGSVEVWVDDLTLTGQGATTIIDTDAIDPFANNGDADNGFQVAAISVLSGGGDVSGVTIEGFAFDTVITTGTNIGVELGEAAVSDVINATVQNNTFTDLNVGVQSNQSSGTTQISGNTMTAIAARGITFEDTLNTGDAVTVSTNNITSVNDALRFAATIADASVIVSGNSLTSSGGDGTLFLGSVTTGSTVTISGNDIEGADDGVDFSGAVATGSTIDIQNNTRIEGLGTVAGDDGLGDGIAFGGAISGAMTSIDIDGNTLIRGDDRGINFRDATTGGPATITDASVTISGNDDIIGVVLDGILFNAAIANANITIGGANAADGNSITGQQDGLDIEQISGGSFTVANNTLITGTTGDGIEFEDPITGGAMIEISENSAINGAFTAITFEGNVTDSTVLIADNTSIAGDQNGIQTVRLSNSTFSVLQNETIMGIADAGILFGGPVNTGSTVEVAGNGEVRGGNDGVSFAFNIQDSNVTIAGNTQITGDSFDGVNFFGDTRDSIVTIGAATVNVNAVPAAFGGNTITGGRDGIFHASGTVITGTSVVTYSDNDVTGAFDGIHFDGIIESAAVTVSDNTNITGLSFEGIFVAEEVENNATVTISGNIISGGDDGVEFDEEIRDDAAIRIAGNTITGNGDGVEFEEEFENNATATISGNTITAATEQGVEINGLFDNSSMTISGNTITGASNGIVHEEEITGTATTTISGNSISGGNGIAFNDFVDTTNANGIQITGNTGITGTNGDGVIFNGPVTDTAVSIGTSTIIGSDDGIDLASMFAGTASATIAGNTVTGTGSEGVDTGNIGGGVAVTIGNNIISGTTGVRLGAVTTTAANGVQIVNNTRITGTTNHGIHLDGSVTTTPITINGNTEIAGANTGIKASDTITNATINLDGNDMVTGGVTGVHFESLSGATVNTANTTITGAATGFKAFGTAAAGATSRLNFTNSAIRGTLGAGLRVTTTTGGSGIDTNLGGGLTLTGLPSLALSGPNQTLVGDTLSDTRFNSVNGGNFIELSNGALFEPGRPTIINGNAAFFDGVQVPAFSFPALVQSIENRLNDFDDNNTLGQIFFRPLLPSDVVDVALLINQFSQIIDSGIRISNPQTPGDLILRPDYPFDILFGDLLANLYPLGGCLPIFDDTGAVASFSCIAPAHGSDISPFVDEYMADLPQKGS